MEVLPYTAPELKQLLSGKYTPLRVISKKRHVAHLLKLFSPEYLDAKTMVVEESYINRDYLIDYQQYYSRCFEDYPKACKRIHFFNTEFARERLVDLLLRPEKTIKDELQKYYLGFIVIKPIPTRIIGYTLLENPLTNAENSINFWGTKNYRIHFFGVELKIHSLAFQEQDKVVAACATTAIWISLNKAADKGRVIVKSPSEITIDAAQSSPDGSRLFPNKGLSIQQICNGFLKSGMVSEVKKADLPFKIGDKQINVVTHQYFKKILFAYAPIGIPILIVIENPDSNGILHAVAAFGYQEDTSIVLQDIPFKVASDRIIRVICHDDQWGPYTDIDFSVNNKFGLTNEWTRLTPGRDSYIRSLVVPLYSKIRISYEDVEVLIKGVNAILRYFFRLNSIPDIPEWSIQVVLSEKYKQDIRSSKLSDEEKIKILTSYLPKYLWIAKCYLTGYQILEFSFDATNVANGNFCLNISCFETGLMHLLKETLQNNVETFTEFFHVQTGQAFYEYLLHSLEVEVE